MVSDCDPSTSAYRVAEIIGMHHHVQSKYLTLAFPFPIATVPAETYSLIYLDN
jgi:hypothetical protein